MRFAATLLLFAGASSAFGQTSTPAQRMAAAVVKEWPAGAIATPLAHGEPGYEVGVLLDGMAAEWRQTADGADYKYIKATVDRYVDQDGNMKASVYSQSLGDIEMGRAIMLVYRVSLEPRYYKAAKFLHELLAAQPRVPKAVGRQKQSPPSQMWVEAEPFRAEYAYTFGVTGDFDDIAEQLLLIDTAGRATKSWAAGAGWYTLELVDCLDWFPADHPQRPALVAALTRNLTAVAGLQDKQSGLWLGRLDNPAAEANVPNGPGSAMLTYAIAKSVRLGYLPQSFETAAQHAWSGLETRFLQRAPDGSVPLSGDKSGAAAGAYLLAGSEIEQASTEALGQTRTALMDGWFNSQVRAYAEGPPVLFHYKWDNDDNNGFSFVGHAFQSYGAKLGVLPVAPTAANLAKAQIYFIVSPDIPIKNPNPHYMDKASVDAIEAWVKAGGVLILMMNDVHNTEFEHMNTLGERFGIHFNPVDRNIIDGDKFEMGLLKIPVTGDLFPKPLTVHMKEICTIATSGTARPVYIDKGDTLIAIARVGKGTVLALPDPWLYNEYTDGRKLPPLYQDFDAAKDIAAWAIHAAR